MKAARIEFSTKLRYTADMKREALIMVLKAMRPRLEEQGVTHLALFGSRARGDNKPDSDVDLLVEVDPNGKFSLLDLIGVEHTVGDEIGLKAHATMRRSLDHRIRDRVNDDAIAVY